MFAREPHTAAPLVVVSEAERFSLKHLRKIHQQLVDNKSVHRGNEALVIEILRVLAEMVVYGDKNSELLFDFFCEKNMLSLFLEIMWTEIGCPTKVHVQVTHHELHLRTPRNESEFLNAFRELKFQLLFPIYVVRISVFATANLICIECFCVSVLPNLSEFLLFCRSYKLYRSS